MEGGYLYQFVDKPLDLLICKICQLVSQDPHETTCCHNTFCKVCIDTANNHGYTSCPLCRHQPIQVTECVQLRRQITSLHVFCDNKEKGCEWIGEVEAIERHKKQCTYYMIKCEYHIAGCDVRILCHLQTEHNMEKAEEHILMVQQKVKELDSTKVILHQTNEALNITKQELDRSKALLNVAKVEIQHTKAKLHETTEELHASQRELQNTNEQLNETMDQLALAHKETSNAQGKLTDSEDQLNHTIKELLCVNQNLTIAEKELAIVVGSLMQIKNHLKSNSYEAVRLVALSAQVPYETRVLPTVFKMSQYMEKKENNLQWHSSPFFTDDEGYKMCLKVSVGGDGNGRGTHVSVGLCLMRGPYDDFLAWPLRETFKITLLNQQLRSHSKTIAYDSVGNEIAGRADDAEVADCNWCTRFISHSKITSAGHLMDDCMYFQVQTCRAVRKSVCKSIFINLCYFIFCYFIVLLIGMCLLQ